MTRFTPNPCLEKPEPPQPIQSRMASRKTGLQVTPRSPSGSALDTCRLIAKSCLNNPIRYTSWGLVSLLDTRQRLQRCL
ncbi:MAG: hypothetical protein VB124_00390 [Burkholderia sp.]